MLFPQLKSTGNPGYRVPGRVSTLGFLGPAVMGSSSALETWNRPFKPSYRSVTCTTCKFVMFQNGSFVRLEVLGVVEVSYLNLLLLFLSTETSIFNFSEIQHGTCCSYNGSVWGLERTMSGIESQWASRHCRTQKTQSRHPPWHSVTGVSRTFQLVKKNFFRRVLPLPSGPNEITYTRYPEIPH